MSLSQLNGCIEETLENLFPARDELWEAARYSLFSGGKRMRPLLTLAGVSDLGGDIQIALQPACALEMIHTYSLIHDDLPAMDNDEVRRGKPTLHRVYGEGHAILTGDFLLTYAFELLSSAPDLSAEQRLHLIKILSLRSGASGMIGGQVLDIAAKGKTLTGSELHNIHWGKTASLIMASLEFSAILSTPCERSLELLARAGEHLGLAFQIQDDFIDQETEEEPSAVKLYGSQGAERLIEKHCTEFFLSIEALPFSFPLIRELSSILIFHKALKNKYLANN